MAFILEQNDPGEPSTPIIDEADTNESDFTPEELADEKVDWKAKALELKGIAKRRATQLKKLKEAGPIAKTPTKESKATPEADTKKTDPSDFDYGQKAFLVSNGIKGKDEMALAKEVMEETGKTDLEDLVESKYFKARLKEFREDAAAKDAVPDSSRRSSAGSRDSVEYWIAKGELPPNTPENRELRTKVVNAKMKAANNGSKFSSTPVVT